MNLEERNLFVNGNRRVIIFYHDFVFGDLNCGVLVQNDIIYGLHERNVPKSIKYYDSDERSKTKNLRKFKGFAKNDRQKQKNRQNHQISDNKNLLDDF